MPLLPEASNENLKYRFDMSVDEPHTALPQFPAEPEESVDMVVAPNSSGKKKKTAAQEQKFGFRKLRNIFSGKSPQARSVSLHYQLII